VPVEEAGLRKEKKNVQRRSRTLEMKAGCSSERQENGKKRQNTGKKEYQKQGRILERQDTGKKDRVPVDEIGYKERRSTTPPEGKTRQTRKEKQSAGTGQHGSKWGALCIWLPLVMANVHHSD
jgi:hypothetical protein